MPQLQQGFWCSEMQSNNHFVEHEILAMNVRNGSEADILGRLCDVRDVRFVPIADIRRGHDAE
jgi:hypothetical protein